MPWHFTKKNTNTIINLYCIIISWAIQNMIATDDMPTCTRKIINHDEHISLSFFLQTWHVIQNIDQFILLMINTLLLLILIQVYSDVITFGIGFN